MENYENTLVRLKNKNKRTEMVSFGGFNNKPFSPPRSFYNPQPMGGTDASDM
jgi:hypothetical protein